MSLRGWIEHELKEVGIVSLYFLGCVGIAVGLRKLILADYAIQFSGLSVAVIGSLVLAKVVLVLQHTGIGTRFDATHPVAIAAGYKVCLYAVAMALVQAGERMFDAYREDRTITAAFADVWGHLHWRETLARVIVVCLALFGYHVWAGIDRRLGEGTLWRTLWKRAGR